MQARSMTLILCAGIVAISGAMTSLASAAELNPAERLRKMSLRIRGIAPSDIDFQNLTAAIAANQAPNFLEAKANEYAMSRWADQKLADNMGDDFRFQINQQSGEREPDEARATEFSDYDKIIRAALQDGQSWPQIMTGTKLEELVRVSTMRERIRDRATDLGMRKFSARATEMGFDIKSIEGAEKALIAFQTDRAAFEGKLPIPADRGAGLRALVEVVRNAKVRDGGVKLNLDLSSRVVESAGKNYTGENYELLSSEDRRVLSRIFSQSFFDSRAGKRQVFLFVPNLRGGADYVQVREEDVRIAACAILSIAGVKDLRETVQIYDACGTLSPFVLPELSKNLDLTARMLSGFFNTSESFKYIRENYDAIARQFPRLVDSNTNAKASTGIPAIARSAEFRRRYFQTRYSQAAAFFRIFLCDEMHIVALVDKSKKTQNSLSSFFETGSAKTTLIPTEDVSKEHVKGDCIGCHRKLDPVKALLDGKAFPANVSVPSEVGVASARTFEFVYDDFDGIEHRVSVPDGKSMLPLLTEQPQFARCQVRKLWNWVVGEDVPFDAKREADLLRLYKETDASPKKMLAYLALRPEFSTDSTFSETPNFSSVRPVLQRCDGCHTSEGTIPSFTALPFGFGGPDAQKNRREHVAYLKDIAIKIDLAHDGVDAKMPPAKAGWSPSANDRDAISRWIMGGALDELSKPTLTKSESEEILRGTSNAKRTQLAEPRRPMATFRPTWRRFFEGYDLAKIWRQKTKLNSCAEALPNDRLVIGLKDVNTGKPVTDQPSNAFREFYSRCLGGVFGELKRQATQGNGPAIQAIGLSQLTVAGLNVATAPWREVPDQMRSQTYGSLIDWYIGPGVLTTNRANRLKAKMSKSAEVILEKNPNSKAIDVAISALNVIANDDEFLTH